MNVRWGLRTTKHVFLSYLYAFWIFSYKASCEPQSIPTGGDIAITTDGQATTASFSCSSRVHITRALKYHMQGRRNLESNFTVMWYVAFCQCETFNYDNLVQVGILWICVREWKCLRVNIQENISTWYGVLL